MTSFAPAETLLWFLSFVSFALAARRFSPTTSLAFLRSAHEARGLKLAEALFFELSETLEAGIVPESDRWEALKALPPPWGRLSYSSVQELRRQGASLVPTLKRLRELARQQAESQKDARARSAQALAQACVCALLVPIFGGVLHLLLPGVSEAGVLWLFACFVASIFALAGALWMMAIADSARFGGLSADRRPWILGALCAGERFLALVRSGSPPDIAWVNTGEFLAADTPGLAQEWGHSVWSESALSETARRNPVLRVLSEAGTGIRRAIQVSLMEGKPCSERVEASLASLRADLRTTISHQLELVATRSLKPLFLCVAPSLMGLLAAGLYLSFLAAE